MSAGSILIETSDFSFRRTREEADRENLHKRVGDGE